MILLINLVILIACITYALSVIVSIFSVNNSTPIYVVLLGMGAAVFACLYLPLIPRIGPSEYKGDIVITTVYEEYLFGAKTVSTQWAKYDGDWCLYSPKNLLLTTENVVKALLENNLNHLNQVGRINSAIDRTKQ